jgi:hypothetical protein
MCVDLWNDEKAKATRDGQLVGWSCNQGSNGSNSENANGELYIQRFPCKIST